MNRLISILFWFYLIVVSVLLFPIAALLRLLTLWDVRASANHAFSRLWSFFYSAINPYWSMTIEGKEKIDSAQTYVLVANHNSFIDILVLYYLPIHFKWVAKDSLFKVPFFGWNMGLSRYIAIRRGDEASKKALFKTVNLWLFRKVSVLFFPEGTRSLDGKLKPFKPGAFKAAIESGVKILPIILTGTRDALPARSLIFSHKAFMKLTVLKAIDPALIHEDDLIIKTNILMSQTHAAMSEALQVLPESQLLS